MCAIVLSSLMECKGNANQWVQFLGYIYISVANRFEENLKSSNLVFTLSAKFGVMVQSKVESKS